MQSVPIAVALLTYRMMGNVHYCLDRKKREFIKENLVRGFKKKKIPADKIVREIMQTHYVDRMIVFLFPRLNKRNIQEFVAVEGLEYLDAALDKNRGCILVHAHLGPSQLSILALGHRGYKVNQLGFRSSDNTSYIGTKVQLKTRLKIEESKVPAKMLNIDRFLRPVFIALKHNEIVLMPGDAIGNQVFRGKYAVTTFLGNKMRFLTGWASLARKTGAPVLPVSLYQAGKSRYKMVIGPPLVDNEQSSTEKEIAEDVERFVCSLEKDVSTFPGQWHFWDEFYEGNLLMAS